jgi:DNA-directed RNA polymerase specialized sigma24 family protein
VYTNTKAAAVRATSGSEHRAAEGELSEVLPDGATISDRIAAFAMVDQMKDATQAQKCMRLSLVGFSASEIAGMLQTTVPTVHQNLYAERKKLKPSEKKSRTARKRSKS